MPVRECTCRERAGIGTSDLRPRKVRDPRAVRDRAHEHAVTLVEQGDAVDVRGERDQRANDLAADVVDRTTSGRRNPARPLGEGGRALPRGCEGQPVGAHLRAQPQGNDERRGADRKRDRDDEGFRRRHR